MVYGFVLFCSVVMVGVVYGVYSEVVVLLRLKDEKSMEERSDGRRCGC